MRLAEWRRQNSRTQEWVANELGVTQPFVSSIERVNDPQIPGAETMRRAYVLTSGAVQPNDFYDVPAWEAERIRSEAEAELAAARRAA